MYMYVYSFHGVSFPPFPVQLRFEEDLAITRMYSGEGEDVPLCETIYPTGNVEDWLLEVERVMRASLKSIIEQALEDYTQVQVQVQVHVQCTGTMYRYNVIHVHCTYTCTCTYTMYIVHVL